MKQSAMIIQTLKKYLKTRGVTYRKLAEEMSLSEASVKRMFSKHAFSLTRLEEVCRILDIDFYTLAVMGKQQNEEAAENLTSEQERFLVGNEKILIFLYFLINGWTIPLIREEYNYSETEAVQMLSRLEKLGILEYHPNNHVRLLISKNAFWQPNGLLWEKYRNRFMDDFLNSPFGLPNERLIFSPGQLSESSLKIIRKKIDRLIKEFNQLAEMDAALPLTSRRSTGLFIGFRTWVFTMIADLRRADKKDRQRG